jgi:hypothetical protein
MDKHKLDLKKECMRSNLYLSAYQSDKEKVFPLNRNGAMTAISQ